MRARLDDWRSLHASVRCSDSLDLFPCGFDGCRIAYHPAKHTQSGETCRSQEVRLAGESEAANYLAQSLALPGCCDGVDELQSCREERRRQKGGAACVRTSISREVARVAARTDFAVLIVRSGTRRRCRRRRRISKSCTKHVVLAASPNYETTVAADDTATADERTWPQADNGQEDHLCVEPEHSRIGKGDGEKAAGRARVARAEGARQSRRCKGDGQTHLIYPLHQFLRPVASSSPLFLICLLILHVQSVLPTIAGENK